MVNCTLCKYVSSTTIFLAFFCPIIYSQAITPISITEIICQVYEKEGLSKKINDLRLVQESCSEQPAIIEFYDEVPMYLQTTSGLFALPLYQDIEKIKNLRDKMLHALEQRYNVKPQDEHIKCCIPPYVRLKYVLTLK